MDFSLIAKNFTSAPVLFFFLGIIATVLKSDLKIPENIGKFFTLYLMFDIGIKGGQELHHSGFSPEILLVLGTCVGLSLIIPYFAFKLLRHKLDEYNAGAIAASYGSVSAVTFATSIAFLNSVGQIYGGHMVAAMALMESPAIIMGLILINTGIRIKENYPNDTYSPEGLDNVSFKHIIREALTNGSVMLLMGSLVIGYIAGNEGQHELKPFVNDIFKGMLCLYLLDMGLLAGSKLNSLKESGLFLFLFALLFPVFNAMIGIGASWLLGLNVGDGLLMTILFASASYIAVPAAMRVAVPQANMSLLIPMSLGITFPFNILVGIPMYYGILSQLLP